MSSLTPLELESLLDTIVCPHHLMNNGVLHDAGIFTALNTGRIKTSRNLLPEQFQPNTLDVRIGNVFLYNEYFEELHSEKDVSIDIPPRQRARIYLYEEDILSEYHMYPVLRSGRGKLGLCMNTPGVLQDEYGAYIDVTNTTSATIRLYGEDRFAQLLFYSTRPEQPHSGHVVRCSLEAQECAKQISSELETTHPYLIFRADSWIAELKENISLIDSRTAKFDELFTKKLFSADPQLLEKGKYYVVQLGPKIRVPNNLSILLLPFIPAEGKAFIPYGAPTCHAEFIDSGYPVNGYGNITGHIAPTEDILLAAGDIVALGILHHYHSDVLHPYGSSVLDSHHASSDGGTLSTRK